MGRQKIRPLTLSAWSFTFLVIALIILISSLLIYRFLQPFPPKTIHMATGMGSGTYASYGELYQRVLARDGIHLELRQTSGAVENLSLLKDRKQPVEAGFIQGTVGGIDESSGLVSLGGLAYTPLWIFYNGKETLNDPGQLQGKRIAVGPEGSGVRKFSLDLLKVAGVTGPPDRFIGLPYAEARQALLDGKVDAVMMFGSPENSLILDLLGTKGVKIMSLSQAEAYARRFPDLTHVVLPRGVIDPAKRNPPSDIHLLSPTVNLIVRSELHPALVYLLLKSSSEIFGGATWINEAGEFPTVRRQDDPISDQAQRYYRSGGGWLYAYLPFWAATFVERVTLILIPLGMIIVPIIGIAPWIYTWRNRSKYYPLYRELRNLEKEILENPPLEEIEKYESRLNHIEKTVNSLRTSVAFYDELFMLKEHIQIVRLRLQSLDDPRGKKPGPDLET